MEGMGIWIFLLLFYLLQALTKRKKKQQQQQQTDAPSQKTQRVPTSQEISEPQKSQTPQRPQRPVSLEDLFNPNKLRDILGVPQPQPVEIPQSKQKPTPKPVLAQKPENDISGIWDDLDQSELSQPKPKIRETASKVASADITDVDESAADFKAHRMVESDIASDRFGERKTAPGEKEEVYTLEYFDEPEDIRNAVILKEILDRPRAFRRQIR
jgi:cytoskeletal protein RodZ